jgi:GcrA cell cycle regulator
MGWTDERVAILKNLWAEGLSASQIAKQLGGGVTRNAVIGKVHRLGLAGRATPSRPAKRPVRLSRPRTAITNTTAPRAPRPPGAPQPSYLQVVTPQLEPLRREDGSTTSVLNLNDRTCRWPIGDPAEQNFAFCGRGSGAHGPYCADHSRMAYQAQPQKKKRAFGEPDELRRMLRLASSM